MLNKEFNSLLVNLSVNHPFRYRVSVNWHYTRCYKNEYTHINLIIMARPKPTLFCNTLYVKSYNKTMCDIDKPYLYKLMHSVYITLIEMFHQF